MKKLSLLPFIVSAAGKNNRMQAIRLLFVALLFSLTSHSGFANVTVTPASGGTNICPTLAVGGGATAYTALGTMTVTEGANNDLTSGANVITLAPPAGWQFNIAAAPVLGFAGGNDITSVTSSFSGGNLVVTITCSGITHIDQFTITGLQVEATSTSAFPAYVYASVAFIPGIVTGSSGTDFANLSLASGTAPSVTISASPSSTICSGTNVTFTPTPTNGGVGPTYQWFVNGSPVGSGGTYSTSLLNNGDVVTVVMTAGSGGCFFPLTATSGGITMTVNPLPATVTVSGGGTFCGSTTITAANGGSGTIYFQGTISNGTSTATPSSSQVIVASGTYYFRAQSAAGCWGVEGAATVTINPLPAATIVTGGAVTCGGTQTITASGGGGGTIYYQGLTSNGTSTATPSVSQVVASSGTYYFRSQSGAGCWGPQGSTVVTINPLPTAYAVTGGGGYCIGGTGVAVGLANSDVGVNYVLFRGGVSTGITVAGTGAAITFGLQTIGGNYTVQATTVATTCTNFMTGSVTVTVNPLPTAFAMTGGGSYCLGGTGVAVGLSGSVATVNYQLFKGGVPTGIIVAGTGSAISFGLQTAAATYTAVATDANGCTSNMTGTAGVSINPLPTAFNVTGGGAYCSGGTGVVVGLSGSVGATNYQLMYAGAAIGLPVAGTGAAISFGLQTSAGVYTVVATTVATGCTNNMTGSATVTINPLPNTYTVIGGGGYCTGGAGVHVGLTSSDAGVSYQLQRGGVNTGAPLAGTGLALDFGLQTVAGSYTVIGTNATTGCFTNMAGSVMVSINPLPPVFIVSGGGSYCAGGAGVAVNLSGSTVGVNYQLYVGLVATGGPVAGTGVPITFGPQTIGGVYTAVATNTTTLCTSNMTGSATIVVNPLPTVYSMTGGGAYCSGGTGVPVGLSGSDVGVNYQLFRGGVATGGAVAGTGAALNFGLQTIAGSYTVVATNPATSCTSNMSGTATVSINALPNAYVINSGGITSYCSGSAGVTINLGGSDLGVNYQLFLGGVAVGSPVAGTGAPITFGPQTGGGTYTAVGTNTTTGCFNNMTGSVTITVNPLPTAFSVTGTGGYCAGGTGLAVGLSGSTNTFRYQLFLGGVAVGAFVTGTGAAISFGLQTTGGTYTVVATNPVTFCTNNMTGSAVITVNPLPNAYTVSGGGSYCAGGTGVDVQLSSSDLGISYQLQNGGVPVGSPLTGTGSSLDFGLQTAGGTYTVVATNSATGCTKNMNGSATVVVNPVPVVFTVTGGGSYCTGGTGVAIGLSGSQVGVKYQLFNLFAAVGAPVSGTGAAITFGLQTAAGFYTVVATTTATGCTSNMTGGVAVTIIPLPTVYNVLGGGGYCAGGTGVDVSLSGSDAGVNYQLFRGATALGIMPGTGGALDFGLQTIAGTYTVVATNPTTTCTNNMSGSATVSINPLPTAFTVSGGGNYCSGGAGLHVFLSSSTFGINYQLFDGILPVTTVAGTGSAIDFGLQTGGGIYTVIATNPVTSCTNNMTGSATIVVNPLPVIHNVTGGGPYCFGGTGVLVGLDNSETGINYQLFKGGVVVGGLVAGTGSALSFGLQMAAGTYTVVASNAVTGCQRNMAGSAVIVINPLPVVYNLSGGGSYCVGGMGIDLLLSGSDTGVSYQLILGGLPIGSPVAGTGSGILDLGFQTTAGNYTVVATNIHTGCTSNMTGTSTIAINPLPTPFLVMGGGGYCMGGTGVDVSLSGSFSGVTYQLFTGGVPVVGGSRAGTGAPLDFGNQMAAGVYTATGTDNIFFCTNNMTGSVTVTINPLPNVYTVSGGGAYCAGGAGVAVIINGSDLGVNYQAFVGGVPTGAPVAGTGTPLIIAETVAGIYTFVATNTSTTCTNNMSGSTTVAVNPLPAAITGVTNECVGNTVTLSDDSLSGVWMSSNTTIATINSLTGVLKAVSAGTYTVSYTLIATGCMVSALDTVDALPVVPALVGSASVCVGFVDAFTDAVAGGAWMSGNTAVATVDISGNVTGVTAGTTNVIYTVTSPFGCSTTVSAPVTVRASPLVTAITGMFGNVCTGLTLALSNITVGGVWTSGNTAAATVSSSGVVTGIAPGASVISYTVTNLSGCTATALYPIAIGNPMTASIVLPAGSATLCHGNPVNLTVVSASGGLTYQWLLSNTPIVGATDSIYTASTTGSYIVVLNNGTCNEALAAVNVINPVAPVVAFDTLGNFIYTGSFTSYQWFLNGDTLAGATSSNVFKPAPGNYMVVVADGNGCTDTSAIFVVQGTVITKVVPVINSSDIKVYPNPATSVLYIDAPVKVYVTVVTTDGKILMGRNEAKSLNVGELANGVYIIMIYDENNMLLKADKFVKMQ